MRGVVLYVVAAVAFAGPASAQTLQQLQKKQSATFTEEDRLAIRQCIAEQAQEQKSRKASRLDTTALAIVCQSKIAGWNYVPHQFSVASAGSESEAEEQRVNFIATELMEAEKTYNLASEESRPVTLDGRERSEPGQAGPRRSPTK